MGASKIKEHAVALISIGVLATAPAWGLYPTFGITIICMIIAAMGYHLLLGYLDLASLGHAAFFGVSAYVAGYITKMYGWDAAITIVVASCVGACMGGVMGYVSIRRKGIYFTMITLAVAQIVYFLCVQAPYTGGEDGLQGIPRPMMLGIWDLGNDWNMYYLCLIVMTFVYICIVRVIKSPFGLAIRGIEAHTDKMRSLGYEPRRHVLVMFIISATICSIAGALKAIGLRLVTLNDVHWMLTGTLLVMTLVGGSGKLGGPIIGAVAITVLETKVGVISNWVAQIEGLEWLGKLTNSSTFVIGLVFIGFVLIFPRGLLGIRSGVKRTSDEYAM